MLPEREKGRYLYNLFPPEGNYNYCMNPLENPFSRRVWKNWARNGFKLSRNQSFQPKQANAEEDKDTTPVAVYLVILIVLLFCVCLAGAGFWYLITNY